MLSKKLHLKIILKVILLMLMCLGFAFFIFQNQIGIAVLLAIVLCFQVVLLIRFLNTTNRKLAFFFNAVENSDTTINFSETTGNSIINELNKNLNRVNKILQEERVKNQTQEQYYQKLLEYTNVGILSINEKGHIIFANQSAKYILNCEVLTHIQQLKKVDKILFNTVAKLTPFNQQLISLSNERETLDLKIESKSIKVDGAPILLISIQNIYSELDTKQVDSWMGLIKVLSHEIMNTLAPITSISESLSKLFKTKKYTFEEKDIEKIAKGLLVIQEQSNALTQFVTAYRSLTKIPKPDKTLVNISSLFDTIIALVNEELTCKNITFQTKITPPNLEIYADHKQITQVLINLLKNAMQALDDCSNGIIKLEAHRAASKSPIIQISDNGPGISKENINKIFIPFFTTKPKGTGIGLSLSKHIMQLHQGHLVVTSTPNKATMFSLVF